MGERNTVAIRKALLANNAAFHIHGSCTAGPQAVGSASISY